MSNSESDWNDAYDQGRNDERTALLAAGYRKQVAVEGDVKVESTVAALREHAHGMLVDCTSEELADDAADLIESQQQRIRDLTERLRIVEAENDDCSETIMSQSRRLADKDATIARVRAEAEALKTLLSFLPSREERAKRLSTSDCRNRRCDYNEPHKHGFACGPKCACGLGMQASPVVGGESE